MKRQYSKPEAKTITFSSETLLDNLNATIIHTSDSYNGPAGAKEHVPYPEEEDMDFPKPTSLWDDKEDKRK